MLNPRKTVAVAITIFLTGCSLFGPGKKTSSMEPALSLSKGVIGYHTRHARWPNSIADTLKYACMHDNAGREATVDNCIGNYKRSLNILSVSQGSRQFFIYFRIKNCSGIHCGKLLSSIAAPGKKHDDYKLAVNRASI